MNKNSPTHIPFTLRVIRISCGFSHTGAITDDGKLYMWGYNNVGQLGDGTNVDKMSRFLSWKGFDISYGKP